MAPPLFGTVSEPHWPDCPTWFVVSARELSELLGVGVQALNEWRQRGIGPQPVEEGIYRPGVGRKKFYRLNVVMAWYDSLQGIDREVWRYDADFLRGFLRTKQDLNESQVKALRETDWGDMLPSFPQPRKR